MPKMKAFVRTEAIKQEVILDEVPIPGIQPDEVLIKVKAFGVGIYDRYFIPGEMNFPGTANFPYVIGSEGAGIITKLGSQISGFAIGDRVIFTTVLQPQGGSWAEYASTKQAALIPLPDTLTFEQGAAVPIAGKTALECILALDLSENKTLFIAGASGAIGTFVIQIAAAKGVRVSGSASKENHEYMKSLGVEKAVDYNDPNWGNHVKEWSDGGVDIALAIQPGTVEGSMNVVKGGGRVITVSGNDQVKSERDITIQQFKHHAGEQDAMVQLISDIAQGKIRLFIEQVYPFELAIAALEKTETRHARGKLIVKGLI